MEITIIHTDEETEAEIELTVEANYTAGEADIKWSRYGATPGYRAEIEIESIVVPMAVEGPHWSPYAKYPVVYMVPWDGELSREDIRKIEKIIEEARGEAAIDACEFRHDLALDNG